jgi:nitrogen fixation/metabolism regulation signal transduction histidine kinase
MGNSLTALTANLSEGFIALDGNLTIAMVNQIAEAHIGQEARQLLGLSVADLAKGAMQKWGSIDTAGCFAAVSG